MVPEGSSVDLSCELNKPSVLVTLWQMLGAGGMYTPRKNVVKYGQVFTLDRATKRTEGTYFCKAIRPRFVQNIGKIVVTPSPKGRGWARSVRILNMMSLDMVDGTKISFRR